MFKLKFLHKEPVSCVHSALSPRSLEGQLWTPGVAQVPVLGTIMSSHSSGMKVALGHLQDGEGERRQPSPLSPRRASSKACGHERELDSQAVSVSHHKRIVIQTLPRGARIGH